MTAAVSSAGGGMAADNIGERKGHNAADTSSSVAASSP